MPNINLYESYNSKLRKFGVNTSTRFQSAYVEAVNLTYAELNDQVFQNQTLEYIDSFDDIIDARLTGFNTLTHDAASNTAIESREFWSVEYDFERKSDTNGFTDTFDLTPTNVVISILNGVASVVGAAVSATGDIPDLDSFTLSFESTSDGNALLVDGNPIDLTYTLGDGDTPQALGALNSHVTSATTGYNLAKTRFLTPTTLLYDFLINEGTGTTVTDLIGAYVITVDTPVWTDLYIEPSSGLDSQYRSVFDMAIDYHLQDGGEWAIEPEAERERKWYGRGIKMARNIFQQNTTYTSPLNP